MLKGAGNLGGPLTQVLSRRNSVTITEGLGSLVAQSAHSPGLKPQLCSHFRAAALGKFIVICRVQCHCYFLFI